MKEEVAAKWLREHLHSLDVDEDTLGDYIASIIIDDNDSVDSRLEVVESILLGSTDSDISSFMTDLHHYICQADNEMDAPEEVKEETESISSIRQQINKERMEAQLELKERKTISNVKEMHQREKILNTYGFDVMDVDENGNLIYRQKKVETDCMEGMNDNKMRVKMAEKAMRESMKAAHDAEVKRNKEAEKKRLADKEKRKTVRQERRGRGNGFM